MMEEGWVSRLGSAIASFMFLWAVVSNYFPHLNLESYFSRYTFKLIRLVHPYIQIKFPEQAGEKLKRNEAYTAIEGYLASTCTTKAKRFKGEMDRDNNKLDLSMDDNEEVVDTFQGAKLWWSSHSVMSKDTSFSFYPKSDEKRFYRLTYHRSHKDLVENTYLDLVIKEGKAAGVKKRQRKLYTNSPSTGFYEYKRRSWIHVPLEHPATFDTVAMDPVKKKDIVQDLLTFSESKDYYARIGKAWKRGYLLYGPPGTGKSSMVAAMANLLDYDIYDLELTAVKNNTMLRKLLIDTTSKSIIVIEDIDCSIDLTGKRKKKKKKEGGDEDKDSPPTPPGEDNEDSKVTLSGLLNFIDGLWSACAGERLIVFTTNHIEKLDPALIRKGRMDKQVELSYCEFEAFKVLAWNYLRIEEHPLLDKVRELMAEVEITPADVAESLIPKNKAKAEEEATTCLEFLIAALEERKSNPIKVQGKEEEEEEAKEQNNDEKKKGGDTGGEKEQKKEENQGGEKEDGRAIQ